MAIAAMKSGVMPPHSKQLQGTSKNSEFAQMQGAEKIFAAPHMRYM